MIWFSGDFHLYDKGRYALINLMISKYLTRTIDASIEFELYK